MTETNFTLPIHDLAERHRGVTRALGESYTEAARVCLDRHHVSPVTFELRSKGNTLDGVVEWTSTDERTKGAWANEIDTTESGAYACALAAIELTSEMVAVHRAETKTGADYYIAPRGMEVSDLEDCYRLEVSGVDKAPVHIVEGRLRLKLNQAAKGKSNLPALASVIGFRAKLVLVENLER